jgi:hypothetical protein
LGGLSDWGPSPGGGRRVGRGGAEARAPVRERGGSVSATLGAFKRPRRRRAPPRCTAGAQRVPTGPTPPGNRRPSHLGAAARGRAMASSASGSPTQTMSHARSSTTNGVVRLRSAGTGTSAASVPPTIRSRLPKTSRASSAPSGPKTQLMPAFVARTKERPVAIAARREKASIWSYSKLSRYQASLLQTRWRSTPPGSRAGRA